MVLCTVQYVFILFLQSIKRELLAFSYIYARKMFDNLLPHDMFTARSDDDLVNMCPLLLLVVPTTRYTVGNIDMCKLCAVLGNNACFVGFIDFLRSLLMYPGGISVSVYLE